MIKYESTLTAAVDFSPLPAALFRRLRIIAGGQVIEDIDYYNRVYHMIHSVLPAERRLNDYAEGFGVSNEYQFNSLEFGKRMPPPIVPLGDHIVFFPLMSGLFNQTKFLPLRYLQGLQIELEVVNQLEEVCIYGQGPNILPVTYQQPQCNKVATLAASTDWKITMAYVKADVVTLDNQLDNEYTDHLMQGKTLPINFSSFVHMMQAVGGTPSPTISLSRSFTRLKTVFVTFYKTPKVADYTEDPVNPGAWGVYEETNIQATHLPLREFNFFYHPQYLYPGDFLYGDEGITGYSLPRAVFANGFWNFQYRTEPEIQLQVGTKNFPETAMRSSTDMY